MIRPRAIILLLLVGFSGCSAVPSPALAGQKILRFGNGTIQIEEDPNLAVSEISAQEWIQRAAVAVTNYLGQFPVSHVTLTVRARGRAPVGGGVTHGGSRIRVNIGSNCTVADLRRDWVLTHEMFHLAFPTLDDRYLWMMEGLSDYLEPIARARVGQLTAAETWREFAEGLPQGQPETGDHGLDNNFTRERIYWGGNLYWLVVDVRIREQTNNRRSLDDAIRAILRAGGNGAADWTLERVLSVGDKATGTTVLKQAYEELGPQPGTVDLNALWRRLGVKYSNGVVTFDDSAPDAAIRRSITSGRRETR